MQAPTLAAVSLDATGGGVAVVGELLWTVFQSRWPSRARLLRLIEGTHTQPSLADKVRFALRLARVQAFGDTDWVLFSHLGLATVQHGVPRKLRTRYGVFLHGIEAWRPLTRGEHSLLAEAEIRIANSRYTAARVMERHPDIGPVHICPLALPPERAAGGCTEEGEAPGPDIGPHAVLVVGRMLAAERYKGHDQLIEAWPQIAAEVPDSQLVIAGHGDDLPRLRDKAAKSAASRSIVFTGFMPRPALNRLYDRAALFALPSRGEGFGLVYLEAMAHRRPSVGSIHDAAGEVIVDGCTGRLVDQQDIDGMAETIACLLRDDEQRRRMGEAGYRRLQEHFAFDTFASRLGALLNGG